MKSLTQMLSFFLKNTICFKIFQTYSAPASLAHNRVWFNYRPREQRMTVAARGINATVNEKDIGTINGVIHVIDRVLGVPAQDCGEMMADDPNMR
jgi:hypothetical protein